ncbi:GNAT family N-acetyltransferase [Alsobacter sp. SYSU M60028]|uniref:GNAT family N-acetyltransferase n=1 Tax=Alsobacter ponti TaxID=2962936 RepID=A0ABT1LCQ6_9HYPH|nr:GNAT family N-acetyltransferase [Alsobacter ponti]
MEPASLAHGIDIRDAEESDLPAILDIYNDAILNTTATFTTHAVNLESRRLLLHERRVHGYPFVVATIAGEVIGFATFGEFRKGDGYAHTVEHTIYVHHHHHGKGVGKQLMPVLIDAARKLGKHAIIGGIDAGNAASLHFHRTFGFVEAGRLTEVGWKFDRWLDLVLMQKVLD